MLLGRSQARRARRPAVEGLDPLRLPSGLAHPPAHVAAVQAGATKAPASVTVVDLQGTIHITSKFSGTALVARGSGNLGAVGTATVSYRADGEPLPAHLALSTHKGRIVLGPAGPATIHEIDEPPSVELVVVRPYKVIGGTGAYARATGGGTYTADFRVPKGLEPTINLTFS